MAQSASAAKVEAMGKLSSKDFVKAQIAENVVNAQNYLLEASQEVGRIMDSKDEDYSFQMAKACFTMSQAQTRATASLQTALKLNIMATAQGVL